MLPAAAVSVAPPHGAALTCPDVPVGPVDAVGGRHPGDGVGRSVRLRLAPRRRDLDHRVARGPVAPRAGDDRTGRHQRPQGDRVGARRRPTADRQDRVGSTPRSTGSRPSPTCWPGWRRPASAPRPRFRPRTGRSAWCSRTGTGSCRCFCSRSWRATISTSTTSPRCMPPAPRSGGCTPCSQRLCPARSGSPAAAPARRCATACCSGSTGCRSAARRRARRRLETLVGSLPDIDRPVQLTHGDIRSANVLVRDHRVAALLDFDEVGLDHRIVDIGRGAALLATRFRQWGPAPVEAQAALVAGYRSVVELSPIELGMARGGHAVERVVDDPARARPHRLGRGRRAARRPRCSLGVAPAVTERAGGGLRTVQRGSRPCTRAQNGARSTSGRRIRAGPGGGCAGVAGSGGST